MSTRLVLPLSVWIFPAVLLGQAVSPPTNLLNPPGSNLEDSFQVNYCPNLDQADGVVNLTNVGSSAGAATPTAFNSVGAICANVYVYRPSQQLAACCSCAMVPNGLYEWPVVFGPSALLAPVSSKPSSVVVKIVATVPATNSTGQPVCDATFQTAPLSLAPGLSAWGTHSHPAPSGNPVISETPFHQRGLSLGEAIKLQNDCNALAGSGQCPACSNGGLAQPATGTSKSTL